MALSKADLRLPLGHIVQVPGGGDPEQSLAQRGPGEEAEEEQRPEERKVDHS